MAFSPKAMLAVLILSFMLLAVFALVFFFKSQGLSGGNTLQSSTSTSPLSPSQLSGGVNPVNAASTTLSNAHVGMKLYRNEQYGFEFWYPEGWEVTENTFGNPSSKFNLVAHAMGTHPGLEPLTINVVTAEFAIREYQDIQQKSTPVIVDGVKGSKYQYRGETSYTDVILPMKDSIAIIIGHENNERYLTEFNEIVSMFKFI